MRAAQPEDHGQSIIDDDDDDDDDDGDDDGDDDDDVRVGAEDLYFRDSAKVTRGRDRGKIE